MSFSIESIQHLITLARIELVHRLGRSEQTHIYSDQSMPSLTITAPLVRFAVQQGLGAFLLESLNPKSLSQQLSVKGIHINETLKQSLKQQWLQQASASLIRAKVLAEYWPKKLPPPMLIKGADLELSLYETHGFPSGIRSSSDWDLLIPDPYYSQVIKLWEKQFGKGIVPQSAHLPDEQPHELGFYIEGLLFEVHKDIASASFTSWNGQKAWQERQTRTDLWGSIYHVPSSKLRLIIFLLNYGKTGGQTRLLDWLDLVLIINNLDPAEQLILLGEDSELSTLLPKQLSTIWQDVLKIFQQTELIEIWPNPLVSKPAKFLRPLQESLLRYQSPIKKASLQLKYCEPHLRAGYLQAKLLEWL